MDSQWLSGFRRGDNVLWRRLQEEQNPRLHALARLLTRSSESDVIVNATWARAFYHRADYEGRNEITAWLITICARECKRFLTHRRQALARYGPLEGEPLGEAGKDDPDPLARIIRGEELARALSALRLLPEREKMAVVFRCFGGATSDAPTFSEVANDMSISLSAASTLYYRGVDRLQRLLGLEAPGRRGAGAPGRRAHGITPSPVRSQAIRLVSQLC